MNEQEALDMMNSDFKLWESAETEELGGGKVRKVLDLPWGIGEVNIILEGLNDGNARRNAVGQYGEYIRGLIDDRINDDAIESRARQAAARTEQEHSEDSTESIDGTRADPPAVPEAPEEPEETHGQAAEGPAGLRERLAADAAALDERIGRARSDLQRWTKERAALTAALEAYDASEDSEEA